MIYKLLALLAIITSGVIATGNWKADTENAKITFTVKGPFGTVHGAFTGLVTDIQFTESNPGSSSITASVDATTVSTGNGLRNRDLRKKEEWFDTDKFPRISFHSKKIEKSGSSYKASGELTIKGITRPADILFSFTGKESTGVFKGKFTVNREAYKLGKPGGSVGSTIDVVLEIPVKK